MKYRKINSFSLLLTICLKSFSLNRRNEQRHLLTGKDKKVPLDLSTVMSLAYWSNSLYAIWSILNLKKQPKEKIFFILVNWSRSSQPLQQIKGLIGDNYVRRFTYDYQKRHKCKIQTQKNSKKRISIQHFAIASLYMAYKLIKSDHKFMSLHKKNLSKLSNIFKFLAANHL